MSRIRAESWGRSAEGFAALWLQLKGYRILARRVRTPAGEIDLIARRGRQVVFVEVKARHDLRAAAEALNTRGTRRIGRAAKFLLSRYVKVGESVRFDAVLVRPWRLPVHMMGAWLGD